MSTIKSPTLKELQLQAKKLGLKGFSKLNKTELEGEIHKAQRKAEQERREKAKRTVPVPTTLEAAQRTLGQLSKGNARKLRKLLRKRGQFALAGARRIVS